MMTTQTKTETIRSVIKREDDGKGEKALQMDRWKKWMGRIYLGDVGRQHWDAKTPQCADQITLKTLNTSMSPCVYSNRDDKPVLKKYSYKAHWNHLKCKKMHFKILKQVFHMVPLDETT